ncbi:MAG TPA: CRISPR-associated endonuclease Cas1, partial [Thermotogota bacterium]|nr:CRISPR-associated endonuclease Cas1 [Thermotogota bacterium]
MKSIYLFNSGTLKRKDNTLVLENEETGKKYIPIENVNDIKVFSEITLNKRILEFLSQNQIPVYFFNHFGHFSGSFMPNQHHSNGCTILKQAEHYMNNEKRLNIATQFVHGAARNMMRLIGYYQSRGSDTEAEKNLIKHLSKDIDHANTINELMGTEAAIRKIYYQALDKIVKYDAFQMIKREKQPPRNYMNTLISYGNSILYANVLTEIHKTPLDSRIG